MEAPAAAAYAVLPVGVDTITPAHRNGRSLVGRGQKNQWRTLTLLTSLSQLNGACPKEQVQFHTQVIMTMRPDELLLLLTHHLPGQR